MDILTINDALRQAQTALEIERIRGEAQDQKIAELKTKIVNIERKYQQIRDEHPIQTTY